MGAARGGRRRCGHRDIVQGAGRRVNRWKVSHVAAGGRTISGMNAVTRPGRTEEQRLDAVRDRLARRFPDLDPDLVDRAIDIAHHRFDGRPVRDFVPLLVERAATATLGGGVSHPTESSDSGAYLR